MATGQQVLIERAAADGGPKGDARLGEPAGAAHGGSIAMCGVSAPA